jgi:hypothetical protein
MSPRLLLLALSVLVSGAAPPKPAPTEGPGWVLHPGDGFALVAPAAWRRLNTVENSMLRLYLNGDGLAAPAVDASGQPVQVGLIVERRGPTSVTLVQLADKDLVGLRSDRRMADIRVGKSESFLLADGTRAVLQTVEFSRVDKGGRRTHYTKLFTVDAQGVEWHLAAWTAAGPGSAPDAKLLALLRAHARSLTFDRTKVRTDDVAAAYAAR